MKHTLIACADAKLCKGQHYRGRKADYYAVTEYDDENGRHVVKRRALCELHSYQWARDNGVTPPRLKLLET